jgi:hypothetical protein
MSRKESNMESVERFIEEAVRNDSNIVIGYYPNGIQQYYPWIPLRHARKIGKLAREETIKEVCGWLRNNVMKYHWYDPYEDNEGYNGSELIEDLKKYFNNK